MPVPFPPSALWDFSLRLYSRPNVPAACLRLQARHGIDVNLLFCCLWRGMEGQLLTSRQIKSMIARVRGLHEQVVRPLRTARTALKTMLDGDPAIAAAMAAVRGAVKAAELDAEHIEQLVLSAAAPERQKSGVQSSATARANAESYCKALGLRLSPMDRADLDLIAAALGDGKSEPPHAVGLTPRKARQRDRTRPLASGRRGA